MIWNAGGEWKLYKYKSTVRESIRQPQCICDFLTGHIVTAGRPGFLLKSPHYGRPKTGPEDLRVAPAWLVWTLTTLPTDGANFVFEVPVYRVYKQGEYSI